MATALVIDYNLAVIKRQCPLKIYKLHYNGRKDNFQLYLTNILRFPVSRKIIVSFLANTLNHENFTAQ